LWPFIQSVNLVLRISNSFKRFDVNTTFSPSSDSSQANMQNATNDCSNRNCDDIVPQLPQSRFPCTCSHARAHPPPFSHFDLSPPRSLPQTVIGLFRASACNPSPVPGNLDRIGSAVPGQLRDVALAFPPSAVDGSKLWCGPARSWLLQGLRPSFMTCGEVYRRGQQERSA
jgi:hypothetical protein